MTCELLEMETEQAFPRVLPADHADSLVIDPTVRGLCGRPYPGHPKGCPNVNHKKGCPPSAPLLSDAFDLAKPVYLIINRFDIGAHIERMRASHPDWSSRQLTCCLYWQPRARKALGSKVREFLQAHHGYEVTTCPEAMGLDVTHTLLGVGIEIEWPPMKWALQVALGAWPRSDGLPDFRREGTL